VRPTHPRGEVQRWSASSARNDTRDSRTVGESDADWTIVNQFGLVFAGQQPTGGHPDSYRQVALAVAQLNKTFVYNASITGPISPDWRTDSVSSDG